MHVAHREAWPIISIAYCIVVSFPDPITPSFLLLGVGSGDETNCIAALPSRQAADSAKNATPFA